MVTPEKKFVIPQQHISELRKLPKRFTFGKAIQNGKFGHVLEATMEEKGQKIDIAVKVVDLTKTSNDYRTKFLPKELGALNELKHQNIVKTHEIKIIDNNVYVFMEKALGGDVLNMLLEDEQFKEGIPEARVKPLYKQIGTALKYMHGIGWAHRDVKCENVLLMNKERTVAKLTDFGFSTTCFIPNTNTRLLKDTFCGTPYYCAPEIYAKKPYDAMKSDVWSLGVVLFVMLNNEQPVSDEDISKFEKDPKPVVLVFKNKNVSKLCKDLLQKHFELDPKKRITMTQVMEHKWFQNTSWNTSWW